MAPRLLYCPEESMITRGRTYWPNVGVVEGE